MPAMSASFVNLPGSERLPLAAVRSLGAVDPAAVLEISVVLRRRAEPPPEAFAAAPLTRSELAERYGADPADVEAVTREVTAAGAEVISADPAARLVRVQGTVGTLTALFGSALEHVTLDGTGGAGDVVRGGGGGGVVRMRHGGLSVPASLAGVVIAVLGLDDRPQAAVRSRFAVADAAATSFTPPQIAAAYEFPSGTGAGRTIAVIELGGGFDQRDLDAYFGSLNLAPPSVTAVGVDGAVNVPGGDPTGADGEVLLDIEVAGAVAPGAAQLVYFAPNTDAGFLDAITQAAHASPAPTAISISWGQSEDQWTRAGPLGDGPSLRRCRAAGHHGHRRGRRQRQR